MATDSKEDRKLDLIHPTVKRLFADGYTVKIFKNQLGSYTATARQDDTDAAVITDHFSPTDALVTIAQKVYGEGMYAEAHASEEGTTAETTAF